MQLSRSIVKFFEQNYKERIRVLSIAIMECFLAVNLSEVRRALNTRTLLLWVTPAHYRLCYSYVIYYVFIYRSTPFRRYGQVYLGIKLYFQYIFLIIILK